jgi:glucose-1-phosphate adenylyltransferase
MARHSGKGFLGRRVVCPSRGHTNKRATSRSGRRDHPKPVAVIERPTVEPESLKAATRSVLAIILGGGAGTRLYPLTKQRAKPAVPIGGAYRLIDVPMSNCINSGISKIYILTQFNSTSLNRHLTRAYNFGNGIRFGGDGFVEILAATQTPTVGGKDWFQGTADAVRRYAWLLESVKIRQVEDIVILSGDHLYRMDYMKFVQKHRETGADITVAAIPCDEKRAGDFGLMKIDKKGRINDFAEKPQGEELEQMKVDTTILGLSPGEAAEKPYIASMGIYVFKKDVLLQLLNETLPSANDFGSEIIPIAAEDMRVQAYLFNDYWEDIGTMKSFFDANLALAQHPPRFEFYDALNPIFTSPRFLPPAKVQNCKVTDAIISHGAYLEDCHVENAIIGLRSRVGKGVKIQDAMLMGADYYESEEVRQRLLAQNQVPIGIGDGTVIQNAICDKNCRVGKNCVIVNKAGVEEANYEEDGIYIRSGIVTVLADATIPDGTVI